MIVLSCSFPRSGSSLLASYIRGIINAMYPVNGQDVFLNQIKNGNIEGVGGFIEEINNSNISQFVKINEDYGSFAIKTHTKLTKQVRRLIDKSHAKAVFIHRDPRDALLSWNDKLKSDTAGYNPSFRELLSKTKYLCEIATKWISYKNVLLIKYVDLVLKPEIVIKRIVRHMGNEITTSQIHEIITSHQKKTVTGYLNYNTGKLSRYKDEMITSELELSNSELGNFIVKMGYNI